MRDTVTTKKWVWGTVFAVFVIMLSPVFSQITETKAISSDGIELKDNEIEKALAQTTEALAQLDQSRIQETAQKTGVSPDIIRKKIDELKELKELYERQLAAVQRVNSFEKAKENLAQQIAEFKIQGLTELPPYKISLLDSLYDDIEAEKQKIPTLQLAIDNARKEVIVAQENVTKAERRFREAEQNYKANKDTAQQQQLEWEFDVAKIVQSIALANRAYGKMQLQIVELELQLTNQRLELYRLKEGILRKKIFFSEDDLNERLLDIETKREETNRLLEKAQITLSANEARLADARETLEKTRGESEIQQQRDVVDAHDTWVRTSVNNVELLEDRLNYLKIKKELWEIRYKLFNHIAKKSSSHWIEKIDKIAESLNRNQAIIQYRLLNDRTAITDLGKKLADWQDSYGNKSVFETKLRALQRSEEIMTERLADIVSVTRLAQLVKQQIGEQRKHFSLRQLLNRSLEIGRNIWNFELLVLDDNAVSIKKVFIAILVFMIGVAITKRVTKSIRTQVFTRTRIDESSSAALEKILYYFFIVLLVLLALHIVNIPLTIFTFLGGAIAIGIGFGAQNLLNNFLSGLIIMIERPVKINDVIELEGNYGRVRDIGARCTLIRLASGVEVLVPNSSILEKNVINWTHSDLNVRFSVTVGVAYGSSSRKVAELLHKAVNDIPQILKYPEPVVLFTDFAESALMFEVFFWMQISQQLLDSRIVRSNLRFRIDELFNEAGITISFPQRDIHLDTTKPLEIKMISPDKRS